MHSTQGALLLAKGDTALCQSSIEAVRFELPPAPTPSEKSPIVFQLFRLDDECTFKLGLGEEHQSEQ
jgi:hypothetical protein